MLPARSAQKKFKSPLTVNTVDITEEAQDLFDATLSHLVSIDNTVKKMKYEGGLPILPNLPNLLKPQQQPAAAVGPELATATSATAALVFGQGVAVPHTAVGDGPDAPKFSDFVPPAPPAGVATADHGRDRKKRKADAVEAKEKKKADAKAAKADDGAGRRRKAKACPAASIPQPLPPTAQSQYELKRNASVDENHKKLAALGLPNPGADLKRKAAEAKAAAAERSAKKTALITEHWAVLCRVGTHVKVPASVFPAQKPPQVHAAPRLHATHASPEFVYIFSITLLLHHMRITPLPLHHSPYTRSAASGRRR